MGTDQINGFSHTTLSLSHDTAYNLLAVDSNQSFSAHVHTTNHGVEKNYYTKATSIGYNGKMYVRKCNLDKFITKCFNSGYKFNEDSLQF